MDGRDYKNLNLDRASIEAHCRQFIETKNYSIQSICARPGAASGLRVVFAKPGEAFATVDMLTNKGGTTTVQYLTGANPELGKELADHLYETINPAEFEHVNMVLLGFVEPTVLPVLELTAEEDHFQFTEHSRSAHSIVWKINSVTYQDELTVTLHTTTGKLQIQGRPLSCYRIFIFNLSNLLDMQGLEKVLTRQDDGKAYIVQQDVARAHLACVLGDAYQNIDRVVEKLLTSGLCVKLATPTLPDYCMLLYPELRSIEGVLKQLMDRLGMPIQQDGFGPYFDKAHGKFTLKPVFSASISAAQANCINDAYTFYNKERHSLFHMESSVEGSRVISDMSRLMGIATRAWVIIKELYIV